MQRTQVAEAEPVKGRFTRVESEERGVAEAIAYNLREMVMLEVPIVIIVGNDAGWGLERELQGPASTVGCELRATRYDIVMLGTFAAWRLGTIQSRALPMAVALRRLGLGAGSGCAQRQRHADARGRAERSKLRCVDDAGRRPDDHALASASSLVADDELAHFFAGTNMARLKGKQVEFFAAALGVLQVHLP